MQADLEFDYLNFKSFLANGFIFHRKFYSDRRETLRAVSIKEDLNPGDTKAVSLDQGVESEVWRGQNLVEAVTLEDIMERFPAPFYIIKTDIQKYDCKV